MDKKDCKIVAEALAGAILADNSLSVEQARRLIKHTGDILARNVKTFDRHAFAIAFMSVLDKDLKNTKF